MFSTACAIENWLERSTFTNEQSVPAVLISLHTFNPASSSISRMTIWCALFLAASNASNLPIPDAAPVITMVEWFIVLM
jgi:hypothetical protein